MTPEHVRSYTSIEEMQRDLAAAERAAVAATTERQRRHLAAAAENPTYWFRVWEDIVIVGESQPIAYQARREVELGGEDYDHEFARFTERHERGYLFGPCYSVIEPDGELGSTHVSSVVWIDPLVFQALREYGWDTGRLHREAPFIKAVAVVGNLRQNIMDTYPDVVLP